MADQTKRKYDSTVARIAGNIASGFISAERVTLDSTKRSIPQIAQVCVELARFIVAEVERTQPAADLREAAEERSR